MASLRSGAESHRRPNVVLILTDDQGYGELGRHGNPILRTPHLDALHDVSLHFERFHVSPTCSPTRAGLMTGRHEFRNRVSHTILGRSLLREDAFTLPAMLREAGYDTGIFGKWHLGDSYPCRPVDFGFAESLCHGGGGIGQTPDWWGNHYFDAMLLHNAEPTATEGYCTDVFFTAALDWIAQPREAPFFCYLATNVPHRPLEVGDEWLALYADAPIDEQAKHYYAMISNLDDNVGRLVARLDALGLADDTLLIFIGDNGSGEAGDPRRGLYNAGMRGAKGSPYEGGTRVPSLWHCPARFGPARSIDALAAHLDLLPTLAELCGGRIPNDVRLDGRSLVPLLTDPDPYWPDRMLVTHVGRWPSGDDPETFRHRACSVRSARYRWLPGELYDLHDDPGETTNVIEQHRRIAARHEAYYEAWWAEVLPELREPVRLRLGNPAENPSRLACHDWHASRVDPRPAQRQMFFWEQGQLERAVTGQGVTVAGGEVVHGAMGAWAVRLERAGRYEFTLRALPLAAGEKGRLKAGEAHLLCGTESVSAPVADGAFEAVLALDLPPGPAWLECWFTNQRADGMPAGAYFVEVRYAGG